MRLGFGVGCGDARRAAPGVAGGIEALLGGDLLAFWDAARAEHLVVGGGRIASWTDTVGAYALVQGEADLRPELTAFGVRFAGGWLARASVPVPIGSEPVEAWLCAEQDEPAFETGMILGLGEYGSGASIGTTNNGGGPELFAYTQDTAYAGGSFGGRHVARVVIGGEAIRVEMDGVAADAVATATAAPIGPMRMGADASAEPGALWSGTINAVLVTRPLDNVRAAQLLTLLKVRAGLA